MPRKKKAKPNPMGRPQIPIDWDQVDKWLTAHLNGECIAELIGMHPTTFYDRVQLEKGMRFTEYSHRKNNLGKGLIQNKQFSAALEGNTKMLEILGQEWLGQGKKNNPLQTIEQEIANVSAAVREIQTERGGQAVSRSVLENEQSLLDKGQGREESKVSA